MIADMCWVKRTRTRGCKNLTTKNSLSLRSHLFFRSPLQKFHSSWGEPFILLRSTDLIDAIFKNMCTSKLPWTALSPRKKCSQRRGRVMSTARAGASRFHSFYLHQSTYKGRPPTSIGTDSCIEVSQHSDIAPGRNA